MASQQEIDQTILKRIASLVDERARWYETAIQTTALCEREGGWANLVTKFDFVRQGEPCPACVSYEYPKVIIARDLVEPSNVSKLLQSIVSEKLVETRTRLRGIPIEAHFQAGAGARNRYDWREWSEWPAEIFRMEPTDKFRIYEAHGYGPLLASEPPYYPEAELILRDLFHIRSVLNGWPEHLKGAIITVLPDFRARICKLVVAMGYLRVELEHPFLNLDDMVLKVYAEGAAGLLSHQSICPMKESIQVDLAAKCTKAALGLLCRSTGEVLDEKSFREGMQWEEEGVVLETSSQDIEQMLLSGEGETIEFKEKLDKTGDGENLAKTAVAFANTSGGTIVFGVTNELRPVGCGSARMLADDVTRVLGNRCDPMPAFSVEVVNYEGKELALIRVKKSEGPIYTVRERGAFIRANGTNRAPTSQEFERLRGAKSILRM